MKLTTKFILLNVMVVVLAIVLTMFFVFMGIRSEINRQAAVSLEGQIKTFGELLKTKGGDARLVDGKLQVGSYVVNGNFELPDRVKSIFGCAATIFMGDTRVATNVLKADGNRAVDTKLTGPAFDALFREGKSYRGEAQVLDTPYLTAYDPIRNARGEVIGALFVGLKKGDYYSEFNNLKLGVVVIMIVISALFSLITSLLVKRSLLPIINMVSEVSDKIHTNISTMSSTMEQQAGFATQLSSSVVEISSTMEEYSSTATQIAQHSQGVVDRADKSLEDTKNGAAEVENLTFKVNDISQNLQANLTDIVELGRKSKEINKIMEIINNIANQTKLIAFNAALEAASAGEAGKRFGVVAVEIRRLADSVVESTGEIENKITEILDSVNRLVMTSEKSTELIQEGQEYASHTVEMLIESVDGVEETASAARQISLSTQQQQIASNQVVVALKEIEEGVRFSTDSIHQSNDVIGELAILSEKLKALVTSFQSGNTSTTSLTDSVGKAA